MKLFSHTLTVPLILLLLTPTIVSGENERRFNTRARVVDLEPVITTSKPALSRPHCQRPVLVIAGSIAQDIRSQEHKQAQQLACEARARPRHKVTGYWVTYEYQGHQRRKYMDKKPGNWIQVTVSLEPLQANSKRW